MADASGGRCFRGQMLQGIYPEALYVCRGFRRDAVSQSDPKLLVILLPLQHPYAQRTRKKRACQDAADILGQSNETDLLWNRRIADTRY